MRGLAYVLLAGCAAIPHVPGPPPEAGKTEIVSGAQLGPLEALDGVGVSGEVAARRAAGPFELAGAAIFEADHVLSGWGTALTLAADLRLPLAWARFHLAPSLGAEATLATSAFWTPTAALEAGTAVPNGDAGLALRARASRYDPGRPPDWIFSVMPYLRYRPPERQGAYLFGLEAGFDRGNRAWVVWPQVALVVDL